MFSLHSDDLDAQVRLWRDVFPPEGLDARIAVLALSHEGCLSPGARPPARRLRGRLVAASGIATLLLAIILLWPGSPGHIQVALADVERAVQQVNIVTATEAHTDYRNIGTPLRTDVSQCWMRRVPSATASVPMPALSCPQNLVRLNMSQQFLQDGRGEFIHEIAGTQVSMNVDYTLDAGARMTPDKMRGMLDNLLHGGQAVPDGYTLVTPARSESARLDGRSVLRIVRQVSYQNKPEDTLCTETYWVDPATLRPLRVEVRAITATTRKPYYINVLTDFRYNVLPPAGVFDWSPPKGSRVEVIYRTPAGLFKTSRVFPLWKGGATVSSMPTK